MNVAISGSRTFRDRAFVERVVDRLAARGDFILYGDAPEGVDLFVQDYIVNVGTIDARIYKAHWKTFGKGAGHERNARMIEDAAMLIAIFARGPRTPGTSNACRLALARGLPVHVFHEGAWTSEPADRAYAEAIGNTAAGHEHWG